MKLINKKFLKEGSRLRQLKLRVAEGFFPFVFSLTRKRSKRMPTQAGIKARKRLSDNFYLNNESPKEQSAVRAPLPKYRMPDENRMIFPEPILPNFR